MASLLNAIDKHRALTELYIITVLRIRHILVRIRIRGSVPLTKGYGSGSGFCYYRQWASRRQNKNF
jgi:hypothetical protein